MARSHRPVVWLALAAATLLLAGCSDGRAGTTTSATDTSASSADSAGCDPGDSPPAKLPGKKWTCADVDGDSEGDFLGALPGDAGTPEQRWIVAGKASGNWEKVYDAPGRTALRSLTIAQGPFAGQVRTISEPAFERVGEPDFPIMRRYDFSDASASPAITVDVSCEERDYQSVVDQLDDPLLRQGISCAELTGNGHLELLVPASFEAGSSYTVYHEQLDGSWKPGQVLEAPPGGEFINLGFSHGTAAIEFARLSAPEPDADLIVEQRLEWDGESFTSVPVPPPSQHSAGTRTVCDRIVEPELGLAMVVEAVVGFSCDEGEQVARALQERGESPPPADADEAYFLVNAPPGTVECWTVANYWEGAEHICSDASRWAYFADGA